MTNLQSAAQAYRMNQINSASPLDLLLMTYDAALVGCGQRDLRRTTQALALLRDALDFSYDEDVAMGLFRLYQYCADLARKGEFDEAAQLLRELRNSWAQVRQQFQPAHTATYPSTPQPQTALSPQLMVAG